MLSFTLLGHPRIAQDGEPLTRFRSQKEAALLIYLAHTGAAQPRAFLADLLWDSSSTSQSLTNLRTVLARLRKRVGEALHVTRQTAALTPEHRQQVDSVRLLQALADTGSVDTAEKAAALQATLAAYQGDFLADFHLANAPQFEAWANATREQIRRQVLAAFARLGQYAQDAGDVETGTAAARRWLQVDALDEAAHALLIQQLLAAGQVHAALAQYEACAALLRAELDVAPSAALTALVRDIRPRLAPPQEDRSAADRLLNAGFRPAAAVRHNLPPAHDQFFGRHNAQQEIHARLDQPWCRLVTITGLGGVGKTRLATTIARSRLSQYRDGVWLIALADVDPDDDDLAETLAVEIATLLDLRLTGSAAPSAQLLTYLEHRQMLLVLDNFEHLLAGVQVVLDIVQRCEQVQLIVTSREALRLRAEWTVTLRGLTYPASDADETRSDALNLFAARRAQQQREAVSPQELTAMRAICRLVAGLPLAIELAAALTRHATAQAIAASLRDGYDALTTPLRDVPARHRGLHVVFEMSWRTLPPELQQRLARLAVFRGGFTAAAAREIAAADGAHLNALADKSLLVHQAETARYALHPVIRAYAAEKRPSADPAPQTHARYYLTLLAQHTAPLQQKRPQESIRILEPDVDNLRRAWHVGLAARQAGLLYDALTSMSIYYQLHGMAHEGEAVMHATLAAAEAWGEAGIPLATRAGLERARFQNRLGQFRPAVRSIQAALQLAAQSADQWAEAMGHVWWGESLWRLGEFDAARERLQWALDQASAIDAAYIVGWSHHQLGIIDDIQSRYAAALEHLQQACALWQAADDANLLSVSLNSVGLVHYHAGDLPAAQEALEASLALCNQIGNRHLQTMLLGNLSFFATEQSDYAGAQYYLQLSLELANANGNLWAQMDAHINLGIVYRRMGELALAVESLERGLHMAETLGDRAKTATALHNLAEARREQEAFNTAESLYARALEITQQLNLQDLGCEVLIGMARLWRATDVQRARQSSAEAVALARQVQNPDLLARAQAVAQDLRA